MSLARRSATLVAALMVAVVAAGPAHAKDAAWESIDLVLHEGKGESVLIVGGNLPQSTKLPVQVSLPVPAGTQLQWAGEILNGPPENDPTVTPVTTTVDGRDIHTFTLTQSHVGQVEVAMPPSGFDGVSTYMPNITWISNQDVSSVEASVRIPRGSTIASPAEGAALEPGPEGYSYYTKTFKDVSAGDELKFTFAYTAPAAPAQAAPAAGSGGAGAIVPIAVFLVLVGAGAFIALKVSQKMAAKRAGAQPVMIDEPDDAAFEPAHADVQPQADHDVQDDAVEPATGSPSRSPRPIVVAVGAVVVMVLAFVVVAQSTKPQVVNGTITRSYPGVGACTSTTLDLTPAAGVDLASSGDKLVDSLATVESIGDVTLYIAESRISVEFCTSSTNEQRIKETLAATGLVVF